MRTMLTVIGLLVAVALVLPSQAAGPTAYSQFTGEEVVRVSVPADHQRKLPRRNQSAWKVAEAICRTPGGRCLVAGPGYCECCFMWNGKFLGCYSGTAS